MHILVRAIKLAGGQTSLARSVNGVIRSLESGGFYLGVQSPSPLKQAHIWSWLNRDKGVVPPAEYVIPIELAVGLSRHELRPDIYPLNDEVA